MRDAFAGGDTHLSLVVPDRAISRALAARHARGAGAVWTRVVARQRLGRAAVRPHLVAVTVVCTVVAEVH